MYYYCAPEDEHVKMSLQLHDSEQIDFSSLRLIPNRSDVVRSRFVDLGEGFSRIFAENRENWENSPASFVRLWSRDARYEFSFTIIPSQTIRDI